MNRVFLKQITTLCPFPLSLKDVIAPLSKSKVSEQCWFIFSLWRQLLFWYFNSFNFLISQRLHLTKCFNVRRYMNSRDKSGRALTFHSWISAGAFSNSSLRFKRKISTFASNPLVNPCWGDFVTLKKLWVIFIPIEMRQIWIYKRYSY